MNEIVYIVFALIVGLILGTLFFGGLWLTIQKSVTSKTPAIWFLSSFLFRTGITLIGFYYTSQGNWKRLLTCLLGFMVARFIVTRLTKQKELHKFQLKKEVSHEA